MSSRRPERQARWGATGSGGRDNSDYNLEAFVPVETTLVDHLAGQLALAVCDTAPRKFSQNHIDLVDYGG